MTVLDQCAKALYESYVLPGSGTPWEEVDVVTRDLYRGGARAVLTFIRCPSPGMVGAAWRKITHHKRLDGVARLGPGIGVREVIEAMVDHILMEDTDEARP